MANPFELTRALVRSLGYGDRRRWPLPPYPDAAVRAGRMFVRALTAPRPGRIPMGAVHDALDEYLLTTDRERLQPVQRMLCGCALLQWIASTGSPYRSPLSIVVALTNLAEGFIYLKPQDLALVAQILDDLRSRSRTIRLDAFEEVLIRMACEIVRPRRAPPASWKSWTRVLKRDANEGELRDLRKAAVIVRNCAQISTVVRKVLVKCG